MKIECSVLNVECWNKRGVAFICCVFLLFSFTSLQAARLHPERWYQQQWQAQYGGEIEVVLPDKTRCDWVNAEYAIEFDFADKWAEAIGQALYYASRLNKKAAIVLIIEDEAEERFWLRMNVVIEKYKLPIKTFLMRGEPMPKLPFNGALDSRDCESVRR